MRKCTDFHIHLRDRCNEVTTPKLAPGEAHTASAECALSAWDETRKMVNYTKQSGSQEKSLVEACNASDVQIDRYSLVQGRKTNRTI